MGSEYLVFFLGTWFDLGLDGLGRAAVEAGEQLALADGLQVQITVVVLAENVRQPYYRFYQLNTKHTYNLTLIQYFIKNIYYNS